MLPKRVVSLLQGGRTTCYPAIIETPAGHKGNSEFCFLRISMFPGDEVDGNIEIQGKQNSLFPKGPLIK